ncbi:hypothetical protein [Actinoplanes sp. NPDC026623]|uniref:hypothetical protein n=1 Tax=Actinoplanes sp. NPDC026623 TaxID=3155610 RepID=UPI00340E1E45
MTALAGLVASFATKLTPCDDNAELLTEGITGVRDEDLPHLHASPAGSTETAPLSTPP